MQIQSEFFAEEFVSDYVLFLFADLPAGPPTLQTERDRYDSGEILRANCTSQPSKPAAILTYLLNNKTVSLLAS